MGRYLDWYLVELESMVEGRLPASAVHDLVVETENHLHDSAEQFRSEGMAQKESELAAIEKFGSARQIAEAAMGNRGKSSVVGRSVMMLSFTAFAILMALFLIGPQRYGQDAAALSLPWICAIAFGVAAMFVQRLPWQGLTALSAATVFGLGTFAGVLYPSGSWMTRPEAVERSHRMERIAKGIPLQVDALLKAHLAFNTSEQVTKEWRLTDGAVVIQPADPKDPASTMKVYDGSYSYPAHVISEMPAGPPTAIEYKQTTDLKLAHQAWQHAAAFESALKNSQHQMTADAGQLALRAKDSVLQSAISHVDFAITSALTWFGGALALGYLAMRLPRALNGKPKRLRRFA